MKEEEEEKEIGVKRLYVVIPQPLFREMQALGYMGEIDTVITKLLYKEIKERRKEEKENGDNRRF